MMGKSDSSERGAMDASQTQQQCPPQEVLGFANTLRLENDFS